MPASSDRSRRFCGLTTRDILKFASNLILPLVLGIFTAVITLHQQNVATQQRLEDRQLAKEQREQDLNISRTQRLEDRLLAREEREQDLNISREQREQDKQTAKLQRDQDKKLTDEKLAHDKLLVEEKMRDDLFVRYMNDITQLLKENNGSLTTDPITAFIVRVKTPTIIRQLDPIRNTHLIRFLYDANQLTNGANSINLSNAELDGINMSMANVFHHKIHHLSLAGAYLRNSSFNKLDLSNSNFSNSRPDGADFSAASANNALLTNTSLNSVVFTRCRCDYTDFNSADLEKAKFDSAQLKNSTLMGAKLVRTVFSNANMGGANLFNSRMDAAEFSSVKCEHAIFVRAVISECSFTGTSPKYADLSYADLRGSHFTQGSLFAAILSYANLINVSFNGTDFRQANLSYSKFVRIDESQLNSAISIQGAQLFNNSIIVRDRNLIKNGDAHCNILINTYWNIQPKNSISIASDEQKPKNCIFLSASITGSSMSQNVSLTTFMESNRHRHLVVVLILVCGGDNQIVIHVTDINRNNIFAKASANGSLETTLINIRFPIGENYRFVMEINFGSNANNSWCDDINFTLESTPND